MLCPKKELCGSCPWSHIPYEKQLKQKIADIHGSFKLKNLDFFCDTILPSSKTAHYRNRMDFIIDFEGRVGMRQKDKWWRVIDNHTCFLADERIEQLFAMVREWVQTAGLSFYDRKTHEGLLRYAVIRATRMDQTMVNVITSEVEPHEQELLEKQLEILARETRSTTLVHSINHTITDVSFTDDVRVIAGDGYIEEQVCGKRYLISPNAFFQTNSHTAPILQKTVTDFCGDLSDKTVLDLYCGTGFFSVALAERARQVIGIEVVEDAIRDANKNAELNGCTNVAFIASKTEAFDWGQYQADLLIVDPPRSGMHDRTWTDILRILPNEIVYISCNYKNFAREMVQLQSQYRIEKMIAIDQFPHTPHVELVIKLYKK